MEDLAGLATESRSSYTQLDCMTSLEIVTAINQEDATVPQAVAGQLPQIAAAIDMILTRVRHGGRLFYIGAGTSGRLGVLDASECPPTFGVDPSMVQGIIAGGDRALRSSIEGAEDSPVEGANDLADRNCDANDVVVAIAASGRTPYCLGALRYAQQVGAGTVALVCNPGSPMAAAAQIAIAPVVGPEVLSGSTRMKAGTAQKMVLNMLSTATMIGLGKVYSNLMVDVCPANEKLIDRARRIVQLATGAGEEAALQALQVCDYKVKQATVTLLAGCTPEESGELLERAGGFVRRAVELFQIGTGS